MSQRNLTDKEIQNYKIRSIIFLFLMIAGLLSAFYFYLDSKEHHDQLVESNKILKIQKDSLENSNATILKQANTIVDLKEHYKQKEQLKDAIDLVQILVNKEADTLMTTDEILAGLHKMAEKEKEKQAAYAANQKKLIKDLFASNERTRVNARRGLSKQYANDPKLVKEILVALNKTIITSENPRNLIDKYQKNISQILYLFTTLSAQNLNSEKANLDKFFKSLEKSGIFTSNGRTMQQIKEIRAKLKAV